MDVNMKIAVIGGSGFIGKYIVQKLLDKGYFVKVVDIRHETIKGAEFYISDITNLNQITDALNDIDIVYCLAGTVLNTARKNPHLAVSLDIYGTSNVLEACIKNSIAKIIYASSFYVYDGLPFDQEVDENQCSSIFNAEMFGVVKLLAERLILEYNRRFGLKYVILRYGPAYGPDDRCTCVIKDFIEKGLQKEAIVIWGRGNRKNQYTYVEDIAEGSVNAMHFENEVFNLISPEQLSIRQIAELLASKYGFKVEYDLSKPEGPSMPYMSSKKAMEKLNWKPLSLEEGVEKTYLKMRTKIFKTSSG
jgi:UDP-glucose 4-epimerase